MVDTRDFKLDKKRLQNWARQQPFPGSFYVEMEKQVEDSFSTQEGSYEEQPGSENLFQDSSSSKGCFLVLVFCFTFI